MRLGRRDPRNQRKLHAFSRQEHSPPKEWSLFEDLCLALFKEVWDDPLAQKNGRRGQSQHGVDVFGSPAGDRTVYWGIQCKGKDANYGSSPTLAELNCEFSKAESFEPKLERWVFATTAPSNGVLQSAARTISVERRNRGQFAVDILGWEEILALLANAPTVIASFYPEHADKLDEVIEKLQSLPSRGESLRLIGLMEDVRAQLDAGHGPTRTRGHWERVEFKPGRDLGPALMGRPLGPTDAAACPRLDEADAVLAQLRTAYSARIAGEPGAGKSVCAYQATLTLAQGGWDVLRLTDPQSPEIALERSAEGRTLYLVDNAHLMQPHMLTALEEVAAPNRMVLSIHNAVTGSSSGRGAIALDAARAVKTIAAALRANLPATLKAVHRADDQVGERMMDVDLGQRIDEAERQAQVPWQFCFVLGGGWRRARQVAGSARAAGADIVLAAVAANQLASRDAFTRPSEIIELCRREGVLENEVDNALAWLDAERLVLNKQDCRCPHQRFSDIVLNEIFAIQESDARKCIGRIVDRVLTNSKYPLAGLRLLLHALRFGNHRWTRKVEDAAVRRLAERCWRAETGEGRLFAALVLEELSSFSEVWARDLIEPYADRFSAWISHPEDGASGVGHLLNYLVQHDKELAKAIVSFSDAVALGKACSAITPETAYGICGLMKSVGSAGVEGWNARLMSVLDKDRFIRLAQEWIERDDAHRYAELCGTMLWWDEDLALQMAESFVPAARSLLAEDPVDGFAILRDIAMPVLRAFDPLNIYVGALAPDTRCKAIARSMCSALDPKAIARQILGVRKRDLQSAAHFLHFLFHWAPKKFVSMLSHLDWLELDSLIGEDWANPTHEAEVLLGTLGAHPSGRRKLRELVARNLDRIEQFSPRLAVIAPEAAIEHAKRGQPVRLAQYNHVDWYFGGLAVALIHEVEPDLVPQVLAPFEDQFVRALSSPNSTFFDESELLISLLVDRTPEFAAGVLSRLDVRAAEGGLADCLRKKKGHKRASALLVEAAIGLQGQTGEMARRLRQRFPKASVPPVTRR